MGTRLTDQEIDSILNAARAIADLQYNRAKVSGQHDSEHKDRHLSNLLADAKSHYATIEAILGRSVTYGLLESYRPFPDSLADQKATEDRVFDSVAEIMAANKNKGGFWFDHETMKFFETRTYGTVHFGRYFIASNRRDSEPRVYQVYAADPDGGIRPVRDTEAFDHLQFGSYTRAEQWLTAMVESGALPDYSRKEAVAS